MKYYAGVGARSTPGHVRDYCTSLARILEHEGYILRSGGARGADEAFCKKVENKEVFKARDASPEALEIAASVHPNWGACNSYVQRLHARNALILLGSDLSTPVEFVVCWTPGGEVVGGTGQTIRIARKYGIKVINLAVKSQDTRWLAEKASSVLDYM